MSLSRAAALCFGVASAFSMVTAACAGTYQKSVTANCSQSNICVVTFPAVLAGKTLDVEYVSCAISSGAQLFVGYSALGVSPITNFDDGKAKHYLIWSYLPGSTSGVSTSMAVPFRYNAGRQPEIRTVIFGGTRSGSCTISGTMLP